MWVQIPAGVTGIIPLLEFGKSDTKSCYRVSKFNLEVAGDGSNPTLNVSLRGVGDSGSIASSIVGDGNNPFSTFQPSQTFSTGVIGEGNHYWMVAAGLAFQPVMESFLSTGVGVNAYNWMHIYYSVDASIATEFTGFATASSAPNVSCVVNSIAQESPGDNLDLTHLEPNETITRANSGAIADNSVLQANSTTFAIGITKTWNAGTVADDGSGTAGPATHDFAAGHISIAGFSIEINGSPFGLPGTNSVPSLNKKVRYADVQMWFGQYADGATAYAKFVTIAGGFGTPANSSIAAAFFGEPHFSFRGPASSIATNLGTGGAFTKTGTVTDSALPPVRFAV